MIISKKIDKSIEKIFDFCKKIYCCVTEKGKSAGWRIMTLQRKRCLSWIAKNDSLNAQKGGLFQAEGAIYKKGPIHTLDEQACELTHHMYSQKANNFSCSG